LLVGILLYFYYRLSRKYIPVYSVLMTPGRG